jgi:hypothetical protein
MQIKVDEELRGILRQLAASNRSEDEWSLIESDDMFQSEHFVGGFDATERAFCFSFFSESDGEYWFQFPLSVISPAIDGRITYFEGRPAEK